MPCIPGETTWGVKDFSTFFHEEGGGGQKSQISFHVINVCPLAPFQGGTMDPPAGMQENVDVNLPVRKIIMFY